MTDRTSTVHERMMNSHGERQTATASFNDRGHEVSSHGQRVRVVPTHEPRSGSSLELVRTLCDRGILISHAPGPSVQFDAVRVGFHGRRLAIPS
ncbi:hypothetical protein A3E39_01795 [Candidatus Uhrbacteria bacterium RIFCSPHIGHO2_12_FULL_60_25]|uniref:Uncharacterized protein n=1 Tax=Candidatus Uhrbacteria bacterium RIFCSPHIGHO2_12_FULL_60_25 TaxID=1802399 RepID=A0A1F7UN95_9BACT|nr:MAG: hypothetical protein A3D73_04165 [Candidatus Uhrbacteria bacterium RIFCSPHIGHO2_02_FULL_60_44]OGL79742.1 MAG: hypothetical protein A3E39_01795 [Candidatus Uhrbacteria bacterium RIFCSPHIGHO2_12_FULL_60_25]